MFPDNVKKLFESKGVHYEFFEHEPVRTCADAERVRGVPASFGAKTMILVSKSFNKKAVAAIVPGDKRINIAKVCELSGIKDLVFPSEEKVEELTGYKPGGVAPFGWKTPMLAFIDSSLLEKEFVECNCTPTVSIKFDPKDLQKLNSGKVANISE